MPFRDLRLVLGRSASDIFKYPALLIHAIPFSATSPYLLVSRQQKQFKVPFLSRKGKICKILLILNRKFGTEQFFPRCIFVHYDEVCYRGIP